MTKLRDGQLITGSIGWPHRVNNFEGPVTAHAHIVWRSAMQFGTVTHPGKRHVCRINHAPKLRRGRTPVPPNFGYPIYLHMSKWYDIGNQILYVTTLGVGKLLTGSITPLTLGVRHEGTKKFMEFRDLVYVHITVHIGDARLRVPSRFVDLPILKIKLIFGHVLVTFTFDLSSSKWGHKSPVLPSCQFSASYTLQFSSYGQAGNIHRLIDRKTTSISRLCSHPMGQHNNTPCLKMPPIWSYITWTSLNQ